VWSIRGADEDGGSCVVVPSSAVIPRT
jgi:hypothetical protein